MKLGIAYPQTELGGSPEAARQVITATEEMGFDHIVIYDHPVGAEHSDRDPPLTGPYTEKHPFHDPFTFLAYAAALTSRVELMTSVLILPERQTVLVAKQATDVSLFSGDRLILAVGTGWNWVEYEALGRDFASRGKMLDEQVPLLRRLWSEDVLSHEGSVERFERAGLVVRPRKMIPIWFGGMKEPAFRRAGRIGDGFAFAGGMYGNPHASWERVKHHLVENGRAVEDFQRNLIVGDGPESAQAIADELRSWRDAGHQYGTIQSCWRGLKTAQEHLAFFQDVAEKFR